MKEMEDYMILGILAILFIPSLYDLIQLFQDEDNV